MARVGSIYDRLCTRYFAARNARPIVLVVALGASWGLRAALLKVAAMSALNHATVIATTTTGVAIGLLIVNIFRGKTVTFTRERMIFFANCALLGYVLPWFLLLFAAARIPATTLSLLLAMIPIATGCLAIIRSADRVSAARVGSIVTGTAAVAVLLTPELRAPNVGSIIGTTAALCATFVYGLYFNYASARWPEGLDSLQMASAEVLVAIPIMIPIYIFAGAELPAFGGLAGGGWAILLLITLFMLDTYLYFESLRLSGPVFTAAGNYVMVVTGIIWGVALLGEDFPRWMWLSLALVLMALVLLERDRRTMSRAH